MGGVDRKRVPNRRHAKLVVVREAQPVKALDDLRAAAAKISGVAVQHAKDLVRIPPAGRFRYFYGMGASNRAYRRRIHPAKMGL
jgi:hypothetical protein